MTITQPNRSRQALLLLRILGISVGVAAVAIMYLYNQTVLLRHRFSDNSAMVLALTEQNTEAQNSMYELLDARRLTSVAAALGMVKETAPRYLTLQRPLTNALPVQTAFEYR